MRRREHKTQNKQNRTHLRNTHHKPPQEEEEEENEGQDEEPKEQVRVKRKQRGGNKKFEQPRIPPPLKERTHSQSQSQSPPQLQLHSRSRSRSRSHSSRVRGVSVSASVSGVTPDPNPDPVALKATSSKALCRELNKWFVRRGASKGGGFRRYVKTNGGHSFTLICKHSLKCKFRIDVYKSRKRGETNPFRVNPDSNWIHDCNYCTIPDD